MRKTTALLALALSACTSVDSTEHCVLTRYGEIVQERMGNGLNWTPLSEPTCFPMTERNFPANRDEKEVIQAQTRDPITVTGDVAIVYRYDPATLIQVFRDKRTPDAAEAEILNAIREGYRNALAGWSISQVFERRAVLSDSVKAHIQRKIGKRAIIASVFVRDIKVPSEIEQARIQAAKQAQVLDQAQKQYVIDSVNARARILGAEADAKSNQLRANSYSSNPKLLDLEIAKALSTICHNSSTCIIGGSAADLWRK